MSSAFELQVTERDNTLNPRQLREAGFLPATVYGKGHTVQSLQVRTYDFTRAVATGNKTFKLVGVNVEGEVKVQFLQTEAVSQKLLNIEFLHLTPAAAAASAKPAAKKASKKEAALASA